MIAKDIVQFLCFGARCVAYGHGTDLTQDVWSAVGKSKQRIAYSPPEFSTGLADRQPR